MEKTKEIIGLKKIKDKVEYISYGDKLRPTEERRKRRAWSYLFAIAAINDIGAGADNCLGSIKEIIATLKAICLHETGYEITNEYATEEVGCNYKGWKKNPYKKEN